MTIKAWIEDFDAINYSDFGHEAAKALVHFMQRYGTPVGTLVEGRRRGDQELLVLDLKTGAPQKPFYPILPVETVGIFFVYPDSLKTPKNRLQAEVCGIRILG